MRQVRHTRFLAAEWWLVVLIGGGAVLLLQLTALMAVWRKKVP